MPFISSTNKPIAIFFQNDLLLLQISFKCKQPTMHDYPKTRTYERNIYYEIHTKHLWNGYKDIDIVTVVTITLPLQSQF